MNNSSDIRKENKRAIYRLMLDGKAYTKQQIARGTGLSTATCNTLLNDMTAQGILTGGQKLSGEVGRSAVLYRIDPQHEQYLALHFEMDGDTRLIETTVFSATGEILSRKTTPCPRVGWEDIAGALQARREGFPAVSQILLGIPGIAEHGIVRHCDLPELDRLPLRETVEQAFGLPAAMENDMHHKAYGYYRTTGNREDVITLGYFPKKQLPGTATIHKGTILRGSNGLAGMAGFLPHSAPSLTQLLTPQACVPFVANALQSIIALLNPGTIVLTGDLMDPETVQQIRSRCAEAIPPEYMPVFQIVPTLDGYYLAGMFQLAVDRKRF